jgi:type III pantothenate kinase
VDGEGVFHGGAIAPGIAMMLRSLHERTDALPQIEYRLPEDSAPFGKDTAEAMRLGVTAMVCGSVRWLAERYALHYEAYPRIIATGGDIGVLEPDGLVETFVPDLQLHGIRRACELLLGVDEEDGSGS